MGIGRADFEVVVGVGGGELEDLAEGPGERTVDEGLVGQPGRHGLGDPRVREPDGAVVDHMKPLEVEPLGGGFEAGRPRIGPMQADPSLRSCRSLKTRASMDVGRRTPDVGRRGAMRCRSGAAGAGDTRLACDMRDWTAATDTFDQQSPVVNRPLGITAGHEDSVR
jgi:hypothetical protein